MPLSSAEGRRAAAVAAAAAAAAAAAVASEAELASIAPSRPGCAVIAPTCARASCGFIHATAPCCQRGSSCDELMSGSVNSAALLAFFFSFLR